MSGFCEQCGAALGEGAKFCAACGIKLESQVQPDEPTAEPGQSTEQPPPYWPPPRKPVGSGDTSPPIWPPPRRPAAGSGGATPPQWRPPQRTGGGASLVLKIAAGVVLAVIIIGVLIGVLGGKAINDATKKQGWSVEVTAPAGRSWSGSFGGNTVNGTGYKVVNFNDLSITAADAQKQDGGNWQLKLVLYQGDKIYDTESTTAPYGVVSVQGSAG